uniref:Glutathione-disulfide reductase n=1 Tax=Opuntia streptacantha TaxID=393608 RepID=A0A7C9CNU8_OPUST
MGGLFSSTKNLSKADIQMALERAKQLASSTPVFIFSKTYCGYCNRVKQLFKQLGASYQAIELDQEPDGEAIQAALLEWTGQRTVPNVFIGGTHIGGCDAVTAKHQQGQLVPLLVEVNAINTEKEVTA